MRRRHKKPKTLKQMLGMAVFNAILWSLMFGVGYGVVKYFQMLENGIITFVG